MTGVVAFLLLVTTMSAILCGHWIEPIPPSVRRAARSLTRHRHRP